MSIGPAVIPRLAALLARPFINRDVTARMARDEVRAATRTTAAVAAPVVAISAIAGSLLLSLSFIIDWTTAQDRARLHAPLVVETGVRPQPRRSRPIRPSRSPTYADKQRFSATRTAVPADPTSLRSSTLPPPPPPGAWPPPEALSMTSTDAWSP
ncbi:hypothetical protein [Paractinoplanes hotanensis]|uniref:Uncharacterized protein n=1 Tax=Paractinoplanes hotanensis TaxID=2906497 RepID=A0ABT0XXR9_9ACTN|nr:hypothetical protein [Actinoplanes hotanensis]MCM4078571.1 hypothetical protein [Actinoplanes hotanensis]